MEEQRKKKRKTDAEIRREILEELQSGDSLVLYFPTIRTKQVLIETLKSLGEK